MENFKTILSYSAILAGVVGLIASLLTSLLAKSIISSKQREKLDISVGGKSVRVDITNPEEMEKLKELITKEDRRSTPGA